jgi:hypothetical protein
MNDGPLCVPPRRVSAVLIVLVATATALQGQAGCALQIALVPSAGPLGIDLSNGLIVTVGY